MNVKMQNTPKVDELTTFINLFIRNVIGKVTTMT